MELTMNNQNSKAENLQRIRHSKRKKEETSIRLLGCHLEESDLWRELMRLVLFWRDWESLTVLFWPTSTCSQSRKFMERIYDYEVFRKIVLKGDYYQHACMPGNILHLALEELDVSMLDLSEENSILFFQGLNETRKLKTLRLRSLRFYPGSFGYLLMGLKANSSIEILDLSNNRLHDKALCHILQSVEGKDNLVELDLASNVIRSKGLHILGRLLSSESCNLQRLSLEGNYFERLDPFLDCLVENSTLKMLNVSRNYYLTSKSVSRMLSLAWKLKSLEEIQISNMLESYLEFPITGSVLHNSLLRIDLSCVGMTLESAAVLFMNLWRFPLLLDLDISRNKEITSLNFQRFFILSQAQRDQHPLPLLQRLFLGSVQDSGKIYLLKLLQLFPRLVEIDIPMRSFQESYLRRQLEHVLDTREFQKDFTQDDKELPGGLWPLVLSRKQHDVDFDYTRQANFIYFLLRGPAICALLS